MLMIKEKIGHSGTITLMTLVLLIMFIIIISAVARFINRQGLETIIQTQENQAFSAADAGIEYTKWLLAANGGNLTPQDLLTNTRLETKSHPIYDTSGQILATFDLNFTSFLNNRLVFTSTGKDKSKADVCQIIDATFTVSNSVWQTSSWHQRTTQKCPP